MVSAEAEIAKRFQAQLQGRFEVKASFMDMRHVDIMVEHGLQGSTGVKTLGDVNKTWEMYERGTLGKVDSARFRPLSARANFLASDCMDIQHSVYYCAEKCHTQTQGVWKKLKRLTI